jgi:hypothetical protein
VSGGTFSGEFDGWMEMADGMEARLRCNVDPSDLPDIPLGQAVQVAWGQQPQRQDSLAAQLRDLHVVAARLGMYDAADWLWKRMDNQ